MLRELHDERPDYDTWKAAREDYLRESNSVIEQVTENLGPVDILFALLGLATAFKLGGAGREDGTPA